MTTPLTASTTQEARAKHSPGPWKAMFSGKDNKWNVVFEDPTKPVCRYPLAEIQDNDGNGEANAGLIAAAPELLEALKSLVAGMREDIASDFTKSLIKQAREAISKAEGK